MHHHLAHQSQVRLPHLCRKRRQVNQQHWVFLCLAECVLGAGAVREWGLELLFLLGVIAKQPARAYSSVLPRCGRLVAHPAAVGTAHDALARGVQWGRRRLFTVLGQLPGTSFSAKEGTGEGEGGC
eukprot:scaffold8374_cov36-Tisochrysis_lutea.AAC.2